MERLSGAELLSWRRKLLRLGGEGHALDWLLDMAAGLSPSGLQALRIHPDRPLNRPIPLDHLEHLWRKHLMASAPLQYLVGRCSWRTFELAVGPTVLIPRPETELLIDLALSTTPTPAELLWADLGTGSGCLAMALAEAWPMSQGLAVDLSEKALDLARINLHKAGMEQRVRLVQGSWLGALKPWWGRLQLVVSNPPYIPSHQIDQLEPVVRDHEPRLALDGGHDGLCSIRTIVEAAPSALAPGGWLLLEHHHDQSEQVLSLLEEQGLVDGQCHRDLEGHKRFVSARRG
ncbi:MAG: peptide chain release factor N(5)-glutamine methyltransferase [Cyanobacteriota bacterium]|jgi:release factor glutamine methyltransferase|nr:peptide chain release factor N(5)-glutamine methyltransferase [Cyanobacteriota bacterium]